MELALSPWLVVNALQITPKSVDLDAPVPVPTHTVGTPMTVSYLMSTTELPAKNSSVSEERVNPSGRATAGPAANPIPRASSKEPVILMRLNRLSLH